MDKLARRIPLMPCVFPWKSKRYSSNPHPSVVDSLLEKRAVVNETPTSAETEAGSLTMRNTGPKAGPGGAEGGRIKKEIGGSENVAIIKKLYR